MVTTTAAPPLPPSPYAATRRGWRDRKGTWRRVSDEVRQADEEVYDRLQDRIDAVTVDPQFRSARVMKINALAPQLADRAEAYIASGRKWDRLKYLRYVKKLDRTLESGKGRTFLQERGDAILTGIPSVLTATATLVNAVRRRRDRSANGQDANGDQDTNRQPPSPPPDSSPPRRPRM